MKRTWGSLFADAFRAADAGRMLGDNVDADSSDKADAKKRVAPYESAFSSDDKRRDILDSDNAGALWDGRQPDARAANTRRRVAPLTFDENTPIHDIEVVLPSFRLSPLPDAIAKGTSHRPLLLTSLISRETIVRLLYGLRDSPPPAVERSSRGRRSRPVRVARRFPGAMALAHHDGWHGVIDVVERSRGRLDWTLSDALFEEVFTASEQRTLADLAAGLAESVDFTGSYTRSFHLMISQPGSTSQPFHYDDDVSRFFATCIIPLTPTTRASGRTEFHDERRPLFPQPGDVLVFDGKMFHRGTANESSWLRAFVYVAYCSGDDGNQGVMKAHLESKVASLSSAVLDEVEVRLGHFYCFQGVRSDELWLARVEAIFREKFAHDEVSLTVRWLYGPTDAWRYKFRNSRERLWSSHLDQTPLRTVLRECFVAVALPAWDRDNADYFVDNVWDSDTNSARRITMEDLKLRPH